MKKKFNPFIGNLDFAPVDDPVLSDLHNWHRQSLAAPDKNISITYEGSGKWKRVASVAYSSVLFPEVSMTKTVFWSDPNTLNQRISKLEYTGAVLSDSIRQTFNYSLDGIAYRLDSVVWEQF